MARKARKKSAARPKKRSKIAPKKKTRAATKKRKIRKARPKSFGARVSSAYHTVVDTFKGTDRLRNRLEPPASSETE